MTALPILVAAAAVVRACVLAVAAEAPSESRVISSCPPSVLAVVKCPPSVLAVVKCPPSVLVGSGEWHAARRERREFVLAGRE